jgi:phosphoribosylglycinamide formyltransferase-1
MGRVAVLASGSGSNFAAIADKLDPAHQLILLISDNPQAYALERAEKRGIKTLVVPYNKGEPRSKPEGIMTDALLQLNCDLVVLAGFMKILTPSFVDAWEGKLINIHPSLLPRHPGAHGIRDSYNSDDKELGLSIHYVDKGVDTGKIIRQESFSRTGQESLEEIEEIIHKLEHEVYPEVVNQLLKEKDPGI